jgi:hypothetical protein
MKSKKINHDYKFTIPEIYDWIFANNDWLKDAYKLAKKCNATYKKHPITYELYCLLCFQSFNNPTINTPINDKYK